MSKLASGRHLSQMRQLPAHLPFVKQRWLPILAKLGQPPVLN